MIQLRHVVRTTLTAVVGFAATVVAAVLAIIVSRRDPTGPRIQRIIDMWSRAWLAAAGVDLRVEGIENVDPQRSYVVVANHSSALDIMACFLAVPLPIRFLAKKELFRIPLLAPAMRAIGIVEVDRQARTAVLEQINRQAKDLVATGRSVIIYPEGTRSRDGTLERFKKGAFTMAVRSGLPVLPVTIHGSYQSWPPGWKLVRGGSVTVVIDPPIETEGLTVAETGQVRDRAHAIIAKQLESRAQS